MTWRTHVVGGIATLWLLTPLPGIVEPQNLGLLAAFAACGALLPDLDAVRSKLSGWEAGGITPLAPVAKGLNAAFGHRGAMHAPSALLWLLGPLMPVAVVLGWSAAAALWLGYASHLALDAGTPYGIPRKAGERRRLHLLPRRLRVTTGSPEEGLFLAPLACAALTLLLRGLRAS